MLDNVLRLAIIGMGPRGLNVFERVCANARQLGFTAGVELVVIDSTRVGTGAVWRTGQSPHLLMNTVAEQVTIFTDDTVEMAGPVERGPSLYEWSNFLAKIGNFAGLPSEAFQQALRIAPETYPPRAYYGHYLRWAFERTRDRYAEWVRVREIVATVLDVRDGPGGFQELDLSTGERLRGLHAVVLTQGHLAETPPATAGSLTETAQRLGLTYIPPGNAADVDMDRIPEREPVLIRGLGLTFFDYLALLTAGRGGRFKETDSGLEYIPSGREPFIVTGCRRGVPHHARGEHQKGVSGRYEPLLLTGDRIAQLRERARRFGDVSFRRDVWPAIAKEVESVYYTRLLADRISPQRLASFHDRYLLAQRSEDTEELLNRFGIPPADRWDWNALADPIGARCFTDPDDFHAWLLAYLDADVHQARLGNVHGPMKAALDVLRDLRNEVRLVVDHGGIAGSSYRDDLDRWYTPMNAFLSIGPPAHRISELAALIRAGVVRVAGPGMRVRADAGRECFVADSPRVGDSVMTARSLIDAWVPAPDLHRTADPLLRNLLRREEVRGYAIASPDGSRYRTGGLAIAPGTHHPVDAVGRIHQRRYVFGVPTEAVRWVTAAGPRPGVNSVTLADGDAIAREILTAHRYEGPAIEHPGVQRHSELADECERHAMTVECGLLAPVGVGTPVESLLGDDAWIEAMLEVELALARAEARLGMVPETVTDHLALAVREHAFDAREIAQASRGAANPVVTVVERLHDAVADVDPVSANYVHYGSTSQDILDTATMVIASRVLAVVIADLDTIVASLAELARRHRTTPIAGRTLAMHAVPTTFGAKVAIWMQGLLDARERLARVHATLPVQLGGAAGTLASYIECARCADSELSAAPAGEIMERLTREFAKELSLTVNATPWHTVRTPIADLASALALTSGTLGKLAVDVISQSRNETAELLEPAAAGRGESSAMPQKRNPVLSTMIRAAALQVPALASTLFGALLAEDERPAGAWHAEWQPLRECLLLVGGAAHTAVELASGLMADADRMTENLALTEGQIVSERLSIRLSPLLGKPIAKKTLQTASFEAQSTTRPLLEILAESPDIAPHLTKPELAELLRPENYLGAAPDLVDRVLRRL
ncbi:3-carboxy-cis,cis-muconate cycloisomerase family FAD/NAD(P)-binding protein [Nocardia sp. CDC160]|uniref:3-carboxy-cis,cis-muconate cycloisomerase family FAD/NAD(P)-binding protein n=1 Tax=Nocardia sp. CDC160 TaxID=3112166 RepID=UPI002DBACEBF|nr:3-carboxy-cis,cis-muconate cycloisomerase family FAD/NAD(P)-binding protein [Nocardia sp. CDC160]MEC3913383.1 3-carboxy-cis,cis-muconate cycloisomerase family FAD/NAD(P)-binding protein [Nocardia sp. CDC160]